MYTLLETRHHEGQVTSRQMQQFLRCSLLRTLPRSSWLLQSKKEKRKENIMQRCIWPASKPAMRQSVTRSSASTSSSLSFRVNLLASATVLDVAAVVLTIFHTPEPGTMGTQKGSRAVAEAIKDIVVEKIRGPGESTNVTMGTFWEDQPVVIHLLRRFGCQLCRGHAVEMAKMLPQLEANNVRVVGIGLEKFGLEEFEEKKYWKSELYIDNGKKIHNALALTKVGWVGTFKMLFANKSVKDAQERTKDTPGNLQGDGRQLGATFVMAKGGEMLLDHRMKDFGDQPTNVEILEALGLDSSQAKQQAATDAPVCTDSTLVN